MISNHETVQQSIIISSTLSFRRMLKINMKSPYIKSEYMCIRLEIFTWKVDPSTKSHANIDVFAETPNSPINHVIPNNGMRVKVPRIDFLYYSMKMCLISCYTWIQHILFFVVPDFFRFVCCTILMLEVRAEEIPRWPAESNYCLCMYYALSIIQEKDNS